MRFTTTFALFAGQALAHYNFESLIINGENTAAYEYVRRTKNSNGPILAVNSSDIICNNGGIDDDVMAITKTFTVAAGSQVGFKMNEYIGHPGPLAVYLSKAPGLAQEYKGEGDWFKVYQSSLSNKTSDPMQWAPFIGGGVRNFTFKLPEDLPAGEYLMRGEHIALHSAGLYEAQFYMGCAQLKVTGSGSGTPGPTVKFPGAYDPRDPGILVNMYWPPLRQYTPPGPAAWPNACDDSTVNVATGSASDGDCTPLEDSAKGDPASSTPPAATTVPTSSTAAQLPEQTPAPPAAPADPTSSVTLPGPLQTTSSVAVAQPATVTPTPVPAPEEEELPDCEDEEDEVIPTILPRVMRRGTRIGDI